MLYKVFLSLHIISVVAWMAGLLYLYRLFVYHVEEKIDAVKERFCMMEDRLYRIITLPAMVSTLVLGLCLVFLEPTYLKMAWLWLKLLLVTGMVGMTMHAPLIREKLMNNELRLSSRTLRILNEVPTLLLFGIVFLVVFKAF